MCDKNVDKGSPTFYRQLHIVLNGYRQDQKFQKKCVGAEKKKSLSLVHSDVLFWKKKKEFLNAA
jgi:hypothetical protein